MKRLSAQIGEEIMKTQEWLHKLQTAHEVLQIIEMRNTEPANDRAKPAKERMKKRWTGGALYNTRKAVIAFLEAQAHPVSSRVIMDAIGTNSNNSTFWKATKELRDEGRIAWDVEQRTYAIVRATQKDVA